MFYLVSSEALGLPGFSVVKNLPASAEDTGDAGSIPGLRRSPGGGHGNPLLVWKIPWTEESAGLQFMGSQRVGLKRFSTHAGSEAPINP